MAASRTSAMANYSLTDAARAVGMTEANFRYHIYKSGYFKGIGQKVGASYVFTDEDLASIRSKMAAMPPPGRKADPAKPKRTKRKGAG
jgi:hypothetical protein